MPLYNYMCEKCGPFDEWQTMARCTEPSICTACGAKSKRAVSTPALSLSSANYRTAHFRNEKSADKPEVVNKPKHVVAEQSHSKSKKGGHSHNHGHGHSHGPSRPWMIGH